MPNAPLSPVFWQVGHLATPSNLYILKRAGIAPATELPENYAGLFATGTGGNADNPPLGTVVQAFDDSHEALVRAVVEADLGTPNEGPADCGLLDCGPFVPTWLGQTLGFRDAENVARHCKRGGSNFQAHLEPWGRCLRR